MTAAARLRTAAAKLREEGGARNVAVANWLEVVANDHSARPALPLSPQALAVADAVLGAEVTA